MPSEKEKRSVYHRTSKRGRELTKIQFIQKEEQAWLLDPKERFAKKSIALEVRKDPLTGDISRILPFRRRRFEMKVDPAMLESSKKGCPFCPDQISSSTPQFIQEIAPEGRIRRGKAVMFPNFFPCARHNWVVVFSEDHFLHLDQFNVEILRDAYLVAQEGIARVGQIQPEFKYASINWNYLPQSGGGLFHPHIQVVIESVPTTSHQKVMAGIKRYHRTGKASYWQDYLSEEMRRGERYIGHKGDVHFLSAFSPRGIFGEILLLFSNRFTIDEVTTEEWVHFSQGLIKIFQYLKDGIISFNLSLFSGGIGGFQSWIYGRLCPRAIVPPWNTSDINYVEKLHDEVVCGVSPEILCEELKPFFHGDETNSSC